MITEGASASRLRSSFSTFNSDTAKWTLLATLFVASVVTAQASPPTTKASNDTLQSNNGVAQASDAPLLPASQQAPIYTGQKAPINTIYRVFGDRVDAGGTPQHGHTSVKPPPHRTAPTSSTQAALGKGSSSQQGPLGSVYRFLLAVRRFLPGGGRGGSYPVKTDHTGRHLLGDGADTQQGSVYRFLLAVMRFLPGGGRGGSDDSAQSDSINMQASSTDHNGRGLLGSTATPSGEGAGMQQEKVGMPGGGRGGSYPAQMLASGIHYVGRGLLAVAGWISTKSTNTTNTSPLPYPVINATMHTAVHVALPPNSSTPTNATSLAAFEAAAAAAVNKAVESEAASLIAAGIAGLAGVTSAEAAASTAGSQQMLANITVTITAMMPVNAARPLVAAAADAPATAEANMTSGTEEPLLPGASDDSPAKAADKQSRRGMLAVKRFNPGAAAHHRTPTKPSKRTTVKELVQNAAQKPSGRKAGAFSST